MFARWNLPKKAVEAIKSVRPGTKFKGQKTVGQIKADVKLKKAEQKFEKTVGETAKEIKKATKSLRDYLSNK